MVPVTIEISSKGATITPRSRWCMTIAGRLIRLGHSRNRKVPRVRHHRMTPEITKNSPHSPAMPITHSPLSTAKRSEEHTSELQSLMRISYAVFCLKKKKQEHQQHQ